MGRKSLIEEKTKDYYIYGEDKEENKRQKISFCGMLFYNSLQFNLESCFKVGFTK